MNIGKENKAIVVEPIEEGGQVESVPEQEEVKDGERVGSVQQG